MTQFLTILLNILVRSAFLGAVLYGGWNFGVTKFFTEAPLVTLWDGIVVMAALQSLLLFTLRPVHKELVPIYIPHDEDGNKEQ